MKNTPPAITVLFYNKIRLTVRCLDSLVHAGVEPDRIFCLDNGSSDDVLPRITAQYPGIHTFKLPVNKGFSGGFNAALRQVFSAGYSTCFFLTNDTVFHAGADTELARTMAASNAGMAAPCIRYLSKPDQIDSLGAFFVPQSAGLGHYHDLDLPETLQPGVDYIPGTALAITREAFETLGGADEWFHTYWEDVDLCFRAHQAGIRLVRCPGARIDHGVGQTCHKKPLYTTFYFQRNRLAFCRRHLGGDLLRQAETAIRNDWSAMLATARQRDDRNRIGYMTELVEWLDDRNRSMASGVPRSA